jgi:2-oxoglutarate dehydrogenase E2 component (dihydrolipoamide succinyltransferase)
MPIDITIPSPGESVTEVTIGAWHKRSGEWVEKDEPLVEIESEKVTLEIPAPESGVLNVTADAGAEKKVGDRIGSIDPGAKKPSTSTGNGAASTAEAPESLASSRSSKEKPGPPPAPDHPARSAATNERATEDAARATSVARKIAQEKGIDLGKLQGTGPSGRIRKSDVLAVSEKPSPSGRGQGEGGRDVAAATSSAIAPSKPAISTALGPIHRVIRREKMSKLRQRIAERLVQAQHTAAMLTTFNEVDCGEMMRLRSLHKEDFEKKWGVGLGFMSFFAKAAVSALQSHPRVNAYIAGDEIEYHDFIDISIAVGTEKGLVVPVIRNAELMSFAEIEATIKDFAVRAKAGKLTIDEMTGGTFTISNGGTYGSLNSTPILNPPQSGILGMHAIKKRAVEYPKDSGSIALRPMMYVALSYDHRIVDGAEAVGFLVHIKNAIENPERMLLGL